MASRRLQVVLTLEERERFRRHAARAGRSLSAWLKEAGRARIAELAARTGGATVEKLRALFRECDLREKGREPDWAEHLATITRSRRTPTPARRS